MRDKLSNDIYLSFRARHSVQLHRHSPANAGCARDVRYVWFVRWRPLGQRYTSQTRALSSLPATCGSNIRSKKTLISSMHSTLRCWRLIASLAIHIPCFHLPTRGEKATYIFQVHLKKSAVYNNDIFFLFSHCCCLPLDGCGGCAAWNHKNHSSYSNTNMSISFRKPHLLRPPWFALNFWNSFRLTNITNDNKFVS